MKFFVSKMLNKQNVFFGEADSFTLITQRKTQEVLLRELKLACLLYDHVILAAAYFWQSRKVYSLIPHIEILIQNGDVLPAIRDYTQTRDANDYLDKRLEESSSLVSRSPIYRIPSLASEIAQPGQRPVAIELNKIGTFLHIDKKSIEAIFRRLWFDDISNNKNPNSLYSLIVMAIPTTHQAFLVQSFRQIGKGQYFSRSLIASAILDLPIANELKVALVKRASELYLLSNAVAVDGDLLISSGANIFLSNCHGKSFGPLSRANVELFMKFLELCELPVTLIDQMSCADLLSLKYSEEFAAFRKVYINLIEIAGLDKNNVTNEILQKFSSMKRLEKEKRGLIRVLTLLEFISSGIFINTLSSILLPGFSPIVPALTASSGAATAASHILKKIKRLQETPILDFTEFVREGKFRSKLYRNIIQVEGYSR